ncbi:MAG: nucleoside hydrolase [Pseudomonadota bacterium]
MQKIIFDTDPGIDDAMALALAELSPALDVIGITTVRGNAEIDVTTRNALYLAERFDMAAGVYRGAGAALVVPNAPVPDFVHGADGLGNINPPPPTREVSSLSAAQFIVDQLHRYPGEVTLVAIGRLTNLAQALALDPDIAALAKSVVVMGGALGRHGHGGNVSPCAEANIHGDPHAADQVFGADWPVVMVGLDVTMQVLMDDARMQRIRDQGEEEGQLLYQVSRFYAEFYRANGHATGFPVHDSSALAYVIDPTLFKTTKGPIRVVCDGIAIGQTIQAAAVDRSFPDWDGRPIQQVCVDVDAQGVLSLYERTLCQ